MRLPAARRSILLMALLALGACSGIKQTFNDLLDTAWSVAGAPHYAKVPEPAPPKNLKKAKGLYGKALAARKKGDDEAAFALFVEAADLGHGAAAYETGLSYFEARGTAQNTAAGSHWIHTAAWRGQQRAQLLLGETYANGDGVPKNLLWAAHWYGRAAAQGLSEAQFAYGQAYLSGSGLPKDKVKGYSWLMLAALGNHENARESLEKLEAKMTRKEIRRAEAIADRFRPRTKTTLADPPTTTYVQQALNSLGFDAGSADGQGGPRTRKAIREFQAEQGLKTSGSITADLLDRLLAQQDDDS